MQLDLASEAYGGFVKQLPCLTKLDSRGPGNLLYYKQKAYRSFNCSEVFCGLIRGRNTMRRTYIEDADDNNTPGVKFVTLI